MRIALFVVATDEDDVRRILSIGDKLSLYTDYNEAKWDAISDRASVFSVNADVDLESIENEAVRIK